jgi:4-amino-4-deoxy-L-arabinose transferase-like glycosyltransferase
MTTTSETRRPSGAAKRWAAGIDYVLASHGRAVAFLAVFSLLAFLPGFFQVPPVDRDEPRFAQASKQMVESGDYVDIRYQDEVRYKKPIGIYWLQAGAVKLGDALGVPQAHSAIWLYRIPSLIGGIGAVLLTYWTALAFVSRRAALLAALMLASSVLLGTEARLAKTDAMLLCAVVAAMGAMARAYLAERRPDAPATPGWTLPAIFWTALAAGVLLKGPLILMFVGLTAGTLAALDRSARWLLLLRPLAGIAWLIVLALPWFVVILSRAGEAFIAESVGQDMWSKVFSGQESHGQPPGYYLLLYMVTFWPAAPLVALAAPSVWAARHQSGTRFLLAWIIPSWIVFEMVMTKLPHYVLPLYPAISILTAGALNANGLSRARWLVLGASAWLILPLVLCLICIIGAVMIGGQLSLAAWPFAAGAVILGLLAWRRYETEGPEHAFLLGAAAAVLVAAAVYGVIIPSLTPLFPSVTMTRILRAADCPNPRAASVGFEEPSLVFLAGTPTLLSGTAEGLFRVDGKKMDATQFLLQGGCRFAFVEGGHEAQFARRAEIVGLRYITSQRFDAININEGRWITIAVYRPAGSP